MASMRKHPEVEVGVLLMACLVLVVYSFTCCRPEILGRWSQDSWAPVLVMCKSRLYQTLVTTSFLANFCDQVNMCVNIYFKALQLWLIPFLLPTSIIKHTDGNGHIEHTDRNGHICYTHFRIIYNATPIYGWVGGGRRPSGGRRPKLLCRALPRSTHFLPCKPNPLLGSDPHRGLYYFQKLSFL